MIFKTTINYGEIRLKGVTCFIMLCDAAPLETSQASALIIAGKTYSVLMVTHTSITFFYGIHPSLTTRLYTDWRGFPDGSRAPISWRQWCNQEPGEPLHFNNCWGSPRKPSMPRLLRIFRTLQPFSSAKGKTAELTVAIGKGSSIIIRTLAWAFLDQLLCNPVCQSHIFGSSCSMTFTEWQMCDGLRKPQWELSFIICH